MTGQHDPVGVLELDGEVSQRSDEPTSGQIVARELVTSQCDALTVGGGTEHEIGRSEAGAAPDIEAGGAVHTSPLGPRSVWVTVVKKTKTHEIGGTLRTSRAGEEVTFITG
jgi:hypothetical protein